MAESKNGCNDYIRSKKYPEVDYPENNCSNCFYGQRSMSECMHEDGDWTTDAKTRKEGH